MFVLSSTGQNWPFFQVAEVLTQLFFTASTEIRLKIVSFY